MKTITIIFLMLFGGTVIYPTIPGTEFRDYSRPGHVIEGNRAYQTIPGTTLRDYSKPGYIIEGGRIGPSDSIIGR